MRHAIRGLTICLSLAIPTWCAALTLADFYRLGSTERTWYLGGVYDSNVIQQGKDGARSRCLEEMGLPGFVRAMSEFVQSLPADPDTAQRKVYDGMNVSLISVLVIDKVCAPR